MTAPIRLMVVDDHSLFRRGLTALLMQDGRFAVTAQAGDVGEALRLLGEQPPDVVLLDNHLPGVRGVDGIPAIKAAAPQTRVLMLTVSEDEDDLAAALQAGADGYLVKTVESDQLCQAIVKVVGGESVVSPQMMTKLVSAFRARTQAAPPSADGAGGNGNGNGNGNGPATGQGGSPGDGHDTGNGVAAAAGVGAASACAPAGAAPAASASDLVALSAREREVLALLARGDSNKLIARQLQIAETTVKIHVQHILQKLKLSSRVQAAVYAISLAPD